MLLTDQCSECGV